MTFNLQTDHVAAADLEKSIRAGLTETRSVRDLPRTDKQVSSIVPKTAQDFSTFHWLQSEIFPDNG